MKIIGVVEFPAEFLRQQLADGGFTHGSYTPDDDNHVSRNSEHLNTHRIPVPACTRRYVNSTRVIKARAVRIKRNCVWIDLHSGKSFVCRRMTTWLSNIVSSSRYYHRADEVTTFEFMALHCLSVSAGLRVCEGSRAARVRRQHFADYSQSRSKAIPYSVFRIQRLLFVPFSCF